MAKEQALGKPSVCGPEKSSSSASCFFCSTCAAVSAMTIFLQGAGPGTALRMGRLPSGGILTHPAAAMQRQIRAEVLRAGRVNALSSR